MTIPKPPRGAQSAGRRLWRAVVVDYELAEHELTLLREAVRTADLCDSLQELVDKEGLIRFHRAHPALVELRQQRILLARLLVALRVPIGDANSEGPPDRLQYRGTRGVYGIKGGAA